MVRRLVPLIFAGHGPGRARVAGDRVAADAAGGQRVCARFRRTRTLRARRLAGSARTLQEPVDGSPVNCVVTMEINLSMLTDRCKIPTVSASITLIPIDRDGSTRGCTATLPAVADEALRATVGMYEALGFEEPWICYLVMADSTLVGTCGFKGPPSDGRVEIAYFTFPGCEGKGFATAMAAQLVGIAREHASQPIIAAQTLPQRNASHRILEKLGFRHTETIQHPKDGTVWEWRLGGLAHNKAVVKAFVQAVNSQDWGRLTNLVAPSFVRHSSAGGMPGIRSRNELVHFLKGEFKIFPDACESICDILAEGDRVAVRHSFRGTQMGAIGNYPPTGRIMASDYLAIYRLVDGVISEAWVEWDNLSGLQQLGHLKAVDGNAPIKTDV